MPNPGFVTRKVLARWYDVPAFLPQFQFYEKHRAVIETNSPEKFLPLVSLPKIAYFREWMIEQAQEFNHALNTTNHYLS